MKKVSVIITTHNRLFYLKKAIKSVKQQTYKNIELIIVDDASNDNTQSFCSKLQDIIYVRINKDESKGGNYARNKGIDIATGDYIALLDDDDEWYPEKAAKQVEFLEKNKNFGTVFCNRLMYVNDGEYEYVLKNKYINNKGDYKKIIFYNIIATTSNLMFRSNIIKKNKFDINLKYWQEYDLEIKLAQVTKIGYIDEVLLLYRQNFNDKNRLTNKIDGWFESVDYINNKYKELIDKLTKEEKKKRTIMIYSDAVDRYSTICDKKKKRKYLWKIFRLTHKPKDLLKFLINKSGVDKLKLKIKLQNWC